MTKIGWTHWPGYIGVKFTGDVRLFPDVLKQIETWKAPRCVFVNSMSDLFQDDVPTWFIQDTFGLMAFENFSREKQGLTPHIFLFLTKRPERMASEFQEWAGDSSPSTTPWFGFGVSVSDQNTAEMMIPPMLSIRHGFRFVSVEPMIGPVDLKRLRDDELGAKWNAMECGLDWVLCGCESGPRRRPLELDWVRSLRDQCADAGVPFYLKQLEVNGKVTPSPALDGVVFNQFPKIGVSE